MLTLGVSPHEVWQSRNYLNHERYQKKMTCFEMTTELLLCYTLNSRQILSIIKIESLPGAYTNIRAAVHG